MKKIVVYIILLIVAGSCTEDLLEKYPLDGPSSATFLMTQTELEMALAGAHTPQHYRPGARPYVIATEYYTDISTNRDQLPEAFMGTPTSFHVLPVWTNMYQGISRANFLLENMHRSENNVPEATFNNIASQARVLRAYYYLILTEHYGDVPFITNVQTLEEAFVSRTNKNTIVDFILTELEEASVHLSEVNQPNTMVITKGAALAIKARAALYNSRWEVAIDAAQRVMAMEGSQYLLHPEYGEITQRAGKTSKEIIWAIQFNYDDIFHLLPQSYKSRLAGGYSNLMPIQSLVDSYECIDGLPIDKSPKYEPQKPFENRDPRLHYTVVVPGSIYHGYLFETHKDSLQTWNYNVDPPRRIPNTDATHTFASFSGYVWRKYADSAEEHQDRSDINPIIIRYADVILMYAEAKIEAGQIDASVYEAINKVRARVNMPEISPGLSQQQLRAAVRRERKYELSGEGVRYYDIRRWGLIKELLNGPIYGRIPRGFLATAPSIDEYATPNYDNVPNRNEMREIQQRTFLPHHTLWPIPNIEILTNPNLVQNPGY